MLIASLAVHVSVVAGIALSYFHRTTMTVVAASEPATSPVMLLNSEETPAQPLQKPASAPRAAARSVEKSRPAALPSPARPMVEKALAASTPSPAPEANPNAHIEALPPEAVLSPTPPPQLDGANGVVFVLDISGSMYEPYAGSTRLAYARQTLSRRIRALRDGTPFAITLYAQRACTSGPLVAANEVTREAAVRFIMRDVDCGGGTNLPAGLASAGPLHAGAIAIVTDGDLNMAAYSLTSKARDILGTAGHRPALTIVGIAPRFKAGADRLLQDFANEQGGTYLTEYLEGDAPVLTSASNSIKSASSTP
jgi:hypothetical protein